MVVGMKRIGHVPILVVVVVVLLLFE